METIKAVQPVGKWKIIVVDSKSSQIINAACKMYDILEENVNNNHHHFFLLDVFNIFFFFR